MSLSPVSQEIDNDRHLAAIYRPEKRGAPVKNGVCIYRLIADVIEAREETKQIFLQSFHTENKASCMIGSPVTFGFGVLWIMLCLAQA